MSISFDEVYSPPAPVATPYTEPTATLWLEDSASDFFNPHNATRPTLWEKLPEWLNLNPVR